MITHYHIRIAGILTMLVLSVNLKSQTSNLKSQTSNLKSQTSNLKSQTSNLKSESGKASFYAKSFSGRKTASGELLHRDSLTCAHRSYPFGTLLKVTNMLNGKQVVVRVNDRGPFRKGRIIDLSWAAANEIGMIAQGIVPVTVERFHPANIPYKPEDDVDLPLMEFEVADIDLSDMIPVWQHKPRIDHQKVKHSMRRVADRSAQELRETEETKN